MRNDTRIKAWGLADDVAAMAYEPTRHSPEDELYRLSSQSRRAAPAVPANTCEGTARGAGKDYLHSLRPVVA